MNIFMKKNFIENSISSGKYLDAAVPDMVKISNPFTEVFMDRLTSGNFPMVKTSNPFTKVIINRLTPSELPNPKEIQRAFLVHIVRRISTELNNIKIRGHFKNSVACSPTMKNIIKEAMDSLMTDTTMNLVSNLIEDAVLKYKAGERVLDLKKVIEKLEQYGWEKKVTKTKASLTESFELKKKHLSKMFADDPERLLVLQRILRSTDKFDKRLRKCIDETSKVIIEKAFIAEMINNQIIVSFRKFEKDDFVFLGKDCSLNVLPE